MKLLSIGWVLFKYVYLPLGLFKGIFNESASLWQLSGSLAEEVMSYTPFEPYGTAVIIFQILTAPSALIAWMVPEGASYVYMAPAVFLGHAGIVAALITVCWFLSPPRFLMPESK